MLELIATIVTVAFVAGYLTRASRESGDDTDAIDDYLTDREAQLRERYTTTDMGYTEFADRVAVIEDPDTPRIMRDAVDTHGIGPAIAFNIARKFDGFDEYRAAGVDELADVHRVGESLAKDLVRE